jgi:hypothetical protein
MKRMLLPLLAVAMALPLCCALAQEGPKGPIFAASRLGIVHDDANLPPAVRQTNVALDVFEEACLGGVMHEGDIAKWASDHKLASIEPSVVAGLLRATPTHAWIKAGANGRESDVILAQVSPARCMVLMIKADTEQAAKGFLDMMAYQEAHGVKLQRFPDREGGAAPSVRKIFAFASTPGMQYSLLWVLSYTTSANAVQLRLNSELLRTAAAAP